MVDYWDLRWDLGLPLPLRGTEDSAPSAGAVAVGRYLRVRRLPARRRAVGPGRVEIREGNIRMKESVSHSR